MEDTFKICAFYIMGSFQQIVDSLCEWKSVILGFIRFYIFIAFFPSIFLDNILLLNVYAMNL